MPNLASSLPLPLLDAKANLLEPPNKTSATKTLTALSSRSTNFLEVVDLALGSLELWLALLLPPLLRTEFTAFGFVRSHPTTELGHSANETGAGFDSHPRTSKQGFRQERSTLDETGFLPRHKKAITCKPKQHH